VVLSGPRGRPASRSPRWRSRSPRRGPWPRARGCRSCARYRSIASRKRANCRRERCPLLGAVAPAGGWLGRPPRQLLLTSTAEPRGAKASIPGQKGTLRTLNTRGLNIGADLSISWRPAGHPAGRPSEPRWPQGNPRKMCPVARWQPKKKTHPHAPPCTRTRAGASVRIYERKKGVGGLQRRDPKTACEGARGFLGRRRRGKEAAQGPWWRP
jgi:hypothetical protein